MTESFSSKECIGYGSSLGTGIESVGHESVHDDESEEVDHMIEGDAHGSTSVTTTHSNGSLRDEVVATLIVVVNVERGKGKRIHYPSTKLREFFNSIVQQLSLSSSSPPSTLFHTSSMCCPIATLLIVIVFQWDIETFLQLFLWIRNLYLSKKP